MATVSDFWVIPWSPTQDAFDVAQLSYVVDYAQECFWERKFSDWQVLAIHPDGLQHATKLSYGTSAAHSADRFLRLSASLPCGHTFPAWSHTGRSISRQKRISERSAKEI